MAVRPEAQNKKAQRLRACNKMKIELKTEALGA
jgi:hypothetical protein